MSGFSDAFYIEKTRQFEEVGVLTEKPPYYVTGEHPPFWFPPREVWEIRGANLTISPVHMAAAGTVHPEKGISLRFPRFIRERDDKEVEEATGPSEIAKMFKDRVGEGLPSSYEIGNEEN